MGDATRSQRLSGSEKDSYLFALDSALEVLASGLAAVPGEYSEQLTAFGNAHQWDWARLPGEQTTYQTLSGMVKRVQREYNWFSTVSNTTNPELNRAYFREVEVSAESGLPWVWNFIRLAGLKRDSAQMLAGMRSYAGAAQALRSLMLEDYVAAADVPAKVQAIHKEMLERSFLEQLKPADILDWRLGVSSSPVKVRKLLALGAEQLWNIAAIRYSASSSLFHLYVIDAWQDIREPVFHEAADGAVSISQGFEAQFDFGTQNEAWYVLRQLDQSFRSLHPVHVSRAILGPFESRYLTGRGDIPLLPVTAQLLAEDPEARLFRFSRQYSFAPKHVEVLGEPRQVIDSREDWRDEVIVCPARYASRVAGSVAGTNVRIFKME